MEVRNEIANVFSNFKIENASNILASTSMLSISNDYGEYTFTLTATIISDNTKQFIGTLSKEMSIEDNEWEIKGEITMDLTATLTKEQSQGVWLSSLIDDLTHDIKKVKQALTLAAVELVIKHPKLLPAVIAIGIVVVAPKPIPG